MTAKQKYEEIYKEYCRITENFFYLSSPSHDEGTTSLEKAQRWYRKAIMDAGLITNGEGYLFGPREVKE